jgi:hypothetical protein
MANGACVGAITGNRKFLRLLDENGYNQPEDTSYKIRQLWDFDYEEKSNLKPPHMEDVIVHSKRYVKDLNSDTTMRDMVEKNNFNIWTGAPDNLFDGLLMWTPNGSGYISERADIPDQSVGFWVSDRPLRKRVVFEKTRYNYPSSNGWRNLPYVGFEEPVDIIPAGTLIRVSLARWWDRNGETEYRCSLQLSGWYDLPTNPNNNFEDDLPL